MLWRARLSSFAVGFSAAAAYGAFALRADLQSAQAQLLDQVRLRCDATRRAAWLATAPAPGCGSCASGAG